MRLIVLIIFLCGTIFSQVTWESLDYPSQGEIKILCVLDENTVLAGTQTGCIYRSTDKGENWFRVVKNFNEYGNVGIAFIKRIPDGSVIVGQYSHSSYKLLKSTDQGNNWSVISSDLGESIAILLDGTLCNIYANSIKTSSNGGQTWHGANKPSPNSYLNGIASFDNRLFLWADNSFYYSDNHAITWNLLASGSSGFKFLNDIFFVSQNVMYGSTYDGIIKSVDGGQTWNVYSDGLSGNNYGTIRFFENNGTLYFGSASGLYYLDDVNNKWQIYNPKLSHTSVQTVAFFDSKILIGNFYGIFGIKQDSLYRSDKGIIETTPRQLGSDSYGNLYYSHYRGFSKYEKASKNWKSLNGNLGSETFLGGANSFAIREDTVVVRTWAAKMYLSRNGGQYWDPRTHINEPIAKMTFAQNGRRLFFTCYEIYPDGPYYIASSDNFADNWHRLKLNHHQDYPYYQDFVSIGNDNVIVFVRYGWSGGPAFIEWFRHSDPEVKDFSNGITDFSSMKLGVDNYKNIFAANPEGLWYNNFDISEWQLMEPTLTNITNMQFSNDNQLAVLSEGEILVLNEEDIWMNVSEGVEDDILHFCFDDENYIYAVDIFGEVFRTQAPLLFDGTPTVPELIEPIDNESVRKLSVFFDWEPSKPYNKGYVLEIADNPEFTSKRISHVLKDSVTFSDFEAGHKYYWRVKSLSMSGESEYSSTRTFNISSSSFTDDDKEYIYSLGQNYPNPFNNSTNVEYTIAQGGVIDFNLYDVTGKLVLSEQIVQPNKGRYTYNLRLYNHSSGVYFLRVNYTGENNNRNSATIKMAYLK